MVACKGTCPICRTPCSDKQIHGECSHRKVAAEAYGTLRLLTTTEHRWVVTDGNITTHR